MGCRVPKSSVFCAENAEAIRAGLCKCLKFEIERRLSDYLPSAFLMTWGTEQNPLFCSVDVRTLPYRTTPQGCPYFFPNRFLFFFLPRESARSDQHTTTSIAAIYKSRRSSRWRTTPRTTNAKSGLRTPRRRKLASPPVDPNPNTVTTAPLNSSASAHGTSTCRSIGSRRSCEQVRHATAPSAPSPIGSARG